ncbi:TetR-like C-terminal domain-containing protein [Agrilactobacillus yilanensis]|uniref:TetR-like C-terminal domain-containing protein n=1 Tax=Agrilactobacillus yilanensis TaxID=2485997 RepID=A0ABW4J873_9LACO|nr:TetR-like C-terminal domain-containing protein [Agrilactobacillus yilanensis]
MVVTKKYVTQIVATHLSQNLIQKLTVNDVIALTTVSRTTFYRNFPNGLQSLYLDIIDLRLEDIRLCDSWSAALDYLVTTLSEQRLLFLNLFNTAPDTERYHFFEKKADQFVRHYFGRQYFNKIAPAHLTFFSEALCSQLLNWFLSGMVEDERQIRQKLDTFYLLKA